MQEVERQDGLILIVFGRNELGKDVLEKCHEKIIIFLF